MLRCRWVHKSQPRAAKSEVGTEVELRREATEPGHALLINSTINSTNSSKFGCLRDWNQLHHW